VQVLQGDLRAFQQAQHHRSHPNLVLAPAKDTKGVLEFRLLSADFLYARRFESLCDEPEEDIGRQHCPCCYARFGEKTGSGQSANRRRTPQLSCRIEAA
jgi:hypothetical protein